MAWRTLLIIAMLTVILTQPAFAQEPESLEQLISSLYSGSVRVVGLAAFLMILYAGIIRMLPFGDNERSNQIIIDAVVGTVLLLSAVIILNAINPDLTQQERSFGEKLGEYSGNTRPR